MWAKSNRIHRQPLEKGTEQEILAPGSTHSRHLDRLDGHAPPRQIGRPGWIPRVSGLPELQSGVVGPVFPWLVIDVVCKVAIGTAYSHVEDQIELLVKGPTIDAVPWVSLDGAIPSDRGNPSLAGVGGRKGREWPGLALV